MSHPVAMVRAQRTLAEASRLLPDTTDVAFPVVDEDGHAIGLLTGLQLDGAAGADRYALLAASVAERAPELIVAAGEEAGMLLRRAAFRRVGHAVVIDAGRAPIGIVSLEEIERATDPPPATSSPPRSRELTASYG
jgi:CBS domain-containing protein